MIAETKVAIPTIITWYDRDIETLSRAELQECIREMMGEIDRQREMSHFFAKMAIR